MEKKPDRSEIIAMTLLFALTLVLTVLKVTRTVSLPWLWVLGPLWLFRYGGRQGQFGVGSWHHAPLQNKKPNNQTCFATDCLARKSVYGFGGLIKQ